MNNINNIVKIALAEDIGAGDVSADLLDEAEVSARIISRESAVICGIEYASAAFLQLDQAMRLDWQFADGDFIGKNQVLCALTGSSAAIITAERVALNFLQTLSGVATQTRHLVDKIAGTNAQLLDTRKTIPGLRLAQKYAVECGGGVNHRLGLFDCVMLKENHITAAGGVAAAVTAAVRKYPKLPLIVEVQNLQELQSALGLDGITRILCDNFNTADLALAAGLSQGKMPLEASGNIDENNIQAVAQTGVDFISTGAITKHIRAVDLSLNLV